MSGGSVVQRIVVAASVPPPIAGQSLATARLLDDLATTDVEVAVVDIGEQVEPPGLMARARRIAQVLAFPVQALVAGKTRPGPDTRFYLQLGGSRAAMVRDIPLLAVAQILRWRTTGHVHAGAWADSFDRLPQLVRRIVRSQLKQLETLITLTPAAADAVATRVGGDTNVVVVRNTVAAELEQVATDPSTACRTEDEPAVLFLSNLIAGKGAEIVVDIAREFAARGRDTQFHIAGGGDQSILGDELPANVHVHGVVVGDAKHDLLRTTHVLVLPSTLDEGEPLAVIEAMFFGLAIVAFATGGLPALVTDANGRLVAPGDVPAMIDALDELLQPETLQRVAQANRSLATDRHGGERHRKAILAALELETSC